SDFVQPRLSRFDGNALRAGALLLVFFYNAALAQVSGPEADLLAARLYLQRHAYTQALPAWKRVLEHSPGQLEAVKHVAQLSLLLEGREASIGVVRTFWQKHGDGLGPR